MRKVQAGFTLIELVVVIVILGILSAVALPKFVDLSDQASSAAASGVAGALASGTAVNYAAKMANKGGTETVNGATDKDVCESVTELQKLVTGVALVAGSGPAAAGKYNITAATAAGTACATGGAGTAVACKIEGSKGGPVDATVICTGA